MTQFEININETAEVLNISKNDAMVLEFLNMATWASIAGNIKAEALAFIGAKHAGGDIDGETKDKLMGMIA